MENVWVDLIGVLKWDVCPSEVATGSNAPLTRNECMFAREDDWMNETKTGN
jgi:hypothetical protein